MAGSFSLMDRWRQFGTGAQLVIMAVLTAVVVAVLYAGMRAEPERPSITTEQYNTWRSECSALVTKTIDTRVFRVGGDTWTNKVNECMLAKATD